MKSTTKVMNIIKIKSIGSTNNYANQMLKEEKPKEGTVIWALEQTMGRGHGKNFWESQPGKNLTFSIILYPDFLNLNYHFYLSKIISLALTDLLETETNLVSIKWPNDIYIGDKKIGGILIENSIINDKISSSIVGIGLNINQKKFPDYLPNPVSLSQVTGKTYDIEDILKKSVYYVQMRYSELKSGKWNNIFIQYLEKLYNLNYYSKFKTKDGQIQGKIIGVTSSGRLIIEAEHAEILTFGFKEIEFA